MVDLLLGILLWAALAGAVVMVVGEWRVWREMKGHRSCRCGWCCLPDGWDSMHDAELHRVHTHERCQPCWETLT